MSRLQGTLAATLGAAMCLGALAGGWRGDAGYIAAGMLVFVIPGTLLLLDLPRDLCPADWPERILAGMGTSLAFSTGALGLASLRSGLGVFERWLGVLAVIIAVLAALALWRARGRSAGESRVPEPSKHTTPRTHWARLLLWAGVLAAAAWLRFGALGYGEYYDDELDVVQSARSLLLGQSSVILEHRKGPTEIWLTAIAAASSGRLDETTTRLPFALASLGAVLATVAIGERWFGRGRGVLAGLLLGAEGIFLAFSRLVQYQGVVLLLVTLVVWYALRFWQARSLREQTFCLAMGAFFWSFALLTHWDGLLSGVPLAAAVALRWLVPAGTSLRRDPRATIRQARQAAPWGRIVAIGVAAMLPPALFYTQLLLHPKTEQAKSYYDARLGYGLFNGAPDFLRHATFYNASPFIVVVLIAAALTLAARLSPRPMVRVAAVGLAAALFFDPSVGQVGEWNAALAVYLVLAALAMRAEAEFPFRLIALWLLAGFGLYGALIKQAGLHFYVLMPAVCLLAAELVLRAAGVASRRAAPPAERPLAARFAGRWRAAFAAIASLGLLALAWRFDAIAYASSDEYALNYPRTALWWSPTFYAARPNDYFFGFPYRYGWSVIGALYRQGILRGKFDTNETYLVTDWYARDIEVARADEPRYYLRVDNAPRAGAPPADLEERFALWGEVSVRRQAKISIYQRKGDQPFLLPLHVFEDERFPSSDPELLARSLAYRAARGDDRAFRDAGAFLDRVAGAGDVIVLDTPLQDGILPYYYRGTAQLLRWDAPDGAAIAPGTRTVYASLFGGRTAERALAEQLYPIEARWFGSVRLAAYAPPAEEMRGNTSGAQFGDAARLVSYAVGPTAARAGDLLRLALTWRAIAPSGARFKVFVHVLDAQGAVIAQRDAEPVAELAPVSGWKPGEMHADHHAIRLPANLPAQGLRIALGFYDPQSGARLPVRDASGAPLPDGRLVIEGITIR